MSQSQRNPISLPPRTRTVLQRYRKRVWMIKLAEGMLSAIFGLAVSYLLVFGLDRLVDTPAWLRVAILTAGMVGMVIIFPLKYHNWVWRHRRLDQVARLLRRKYPRFGDHVLAVVELACADADRLSSPALVEAAIRQVDEELEHRDLEDAVPNPRHYHWAWAAAVPVVVAVALMICVPAASHNALARWLMPWSDVDRYTFAQLEGEPSLRVTPYAEPFGVGVQLKEDSPWKPESGTARYEKQPPLATQLQGAAYQFQSPPQTEDGHVFIRVGDARRAIPIEPKMRPELKELLAKIQHPEYLQRPEPETEDVRGGSVRLVRGTGSSVLFEATATRDLAHATLNDRPQCVDGPDHHRNDCRRGFGRTPPGVARSSGPCHARTPGLAGGHPRRQCAKGWV